MKIPNGWKKVKFGDVVNKINDKVQNRDEWTFNRYIGGEHFDEGEIRVTRSAPIEGNEEVIGSAFHMRFKPGQVLYVTRNPRLRKGGMTDFEGVCSNVSFVMEADEKQLLQSLLPFVIQTEDFVKHTCNNAHGSTNPFLNWKDIAKFEFLLPPLEEQKKISEVLWGVEDCLKYNKELLQKVTMFNKKCMKHVLFANKTKKELAKDFLKLDYGSGLTEANRKEGNVPVIGSTGITGYHDEWLIKGPAIIVGRKGNAGNVIYIEENNYPIDTTYYVDIKPDKVLLKYVYYLLKNTNLSRYIEVTAVPGLNREYVHKLMMPLPDKNRQKEIIELFEKLVSEQNILEENILNLTNLRNKLSNELLKGELRLD